MNRRDWLEHALADCIAIGIYAGLFAAWIVWAVAVLVEAAT